VVLITVGIASLVTVFSVVLYIRAKDVLEGQIKERLMNIAAIASTQFDGQELQTIPLNGDRSSAVYRKTVNKLYGIKQSVPDIHFVYILGKTEDPSTLVFLADADAALTARERDENGNGVVDIDEEPSYPGDLYSISQAPAMAKALEHPTVDDNILFDQWGPSISGYAPIRRSDTGEVIGIIGFDMRATQFTFGSQAILPPLVFALILVATIVIALYIVYLFMRRREEEYKRLDEERSGLMLLTYHQLGGPLTIFKWAVEALATRDPKEPLEPLVTDHLSSMHEGIIRMDRILGDLHQAALVQEGHVEVQAKPTRVDDLLRSLIDDVRDKADAKGITVSLDCEPNLRCKIDPEIITHVTYQLLSNALAYTPRKGTVEVIAERHHKKLSIHVKDNGSGVPASDIPRLFEKFVRGANAARLQPDGNGLGLFIAKGLTEAAGGHISISTREGEGTTVSFTVPIS
jgi:signal transduction histidine kinase